jgi:peroxiredoxin
MAATCFRVSQLRGLKRAGQENMRIIQLSLRLNLLLMVSLWLFVTQLPARENLKIPRPAPVFILPSWDGKVLKSASLKGQVVVLEFLQSWCPDCQKTSPELERIYRKYKDQGLTVVGISHDGEGRKAVEPFVKKYDLTYPVLLGDLSIAINYIGITREDASFHIPYLILIDRQGTIVAQYEEGVNPEATNIPRLELRIKKLLEAASVNVEPSSPKP